MFPSNRRKRPNLNYDEDDDDPTLNVDNDDSEGDANYDPVVERYMYETRVERRDRKAREANRRQATTEGAWNPINGRTAPLPAQPTPSYFPAPVFEDQPGVVVSPTDNFPYYDDSRRTILEILENEEGAQQRIDRASLAMGIERKPVFQPMIRSAATDDLTWHNMWMKRKNARVKAEFIHSQKLDPNNEIYDADYAAAHTADRASRAQRNAQRRAAALAHRRAHDAAKGLPRVATPAPPPDSGDEQYAPRQWATISGQPGEPYLQGPPADGEGFEQLDYIPEPGQFPTGKRTNPPSDRCHPCEAKKKLCDLREKGWYPCSQCIKLGIQAQCVNGKGRVRAEKLAGAGAAPQKGKGKARQNDDEEDDDNLSVVSSPPSDDEDYDDDNDNAPAKPPRRKYTRAEIQFRTKRGGNTSWEKPPLPTNVIQLGYTPKWGKWPVNVRTNPQCTRCSYCEHTKKGNCDLWTTGYPCTPCKVAGHPQYCVNGKGYTTGPKKFLGQNATANTDDQRDQVAKTDAFNEVNPPVAPAPRRQRGEKRLPAPAPPSSRRDRRGGRRRSDRSASPASRRESTRHISQCTNCLNAVVDCEGGNPCNFCAQRGLPCDFGRRIPDYRSERGGLPRQQDQYDDMDPRKNFDPTYQAPYDPNDESTWNGFSAMSPPRRQEPFGNQDPEGTNPYEQEPGVYDNSYTGQNLLDEFAAQDLGGYTFGSIGTIGPPPANTQRQYSPFAAPSAFEYNPEATIHNNVVLPAGPLPNYGAGTVRATREAILNSDVQVYQTLDAHRLQMEAMQNNQAADPIDTDMNEAPRTDNEADFLLQFIVDDDEPIGRNLSPGEEMGLRTTPASFGASFFDQDFASQPPSYNAGSPSNHNAMVPRVMIPRTNVAFPTIALFTWDNSGNLGGPNIDPFNGRVNTTNDLFGFDQAAGLEEEYTCWEPKDCCNGRRFADYNYNGDICRKPFAKDCEFQDHQPHRVDNTQVCADCHQHQEIFFSEVHATIERNLRAYVCGDCATTIREQNLSRSGRCECFAKLKAGWFCVLHSNEVTVNMISGITAMGDWFTRAFPQHAMQNIAPCIVCTQKPAEPDRGVWGCKVCRSWAHQ